MSPLRHISRSILAGLTAIALASCASATKDVDTSAQTAEPEGPPEGYIEVLKYEQRTAELLDTTEELQTARTSLDDQQRRLQIICTDYPDHHVCAPQTAAAYAREAFCADGEFTNHVDEVVNACHQGQCKQVDQAELITRTQYMTLVQRLPHSLVTFRAAKSNLDRGDREQLQKFVEQVGADQGGYVIIVGRASKDGPWKKNLRYALDRAEETRSYLVNQLGIDESRVGYITYGHEKMYLTELDAERLSTKKLSQKQANRSALVFAYPCYEAAAAAVAPAAPAEPTPAPTTAY